MDPYIIAVKVIPNHRLAIEFNDGVTVTKDLSPLIARGNLYADLEDEKFVWQFQISHQGYALLWPNGLEFCADALRLQGEKQPPNKRPKRIASLTH